MRRGPVREHLLTSGAFLLQREGIFSRTPSQGSSGGQVLLHSGRALGTRGGGRRGDVRISCQGIERGAYDPGRGDRRRIQRDRRELVERVNDRTPGRRGLLNARHFEPHRALAASRLRWLLVFAADLLGTPRRPRICAAAVLARRASVRPGLTVSCPALPFTSGPDSRAASSRRSAEEIRAQAWSRLAKSAPERSGRSSRTFLNVSRAPSVQCSGRAGRRSGSQPKLASFRGKGGNGGLGKTSGLPARTGRS